MNLKPIDRENPPPLWWGIECEGAHIGDLTLIVSGRATGNQVLRHLEHRPLCNHIFMDAEFLINSPGWKTAEKAEALHQMAFNQLHARRSKRHITVLVRNPDHIKFVNELRNYDNIQRPWISLYVLFESQAFLGLEPCDEIAVASHLGASMSIKCGDMVPCAKEEYWFDHFAEEGMPCEKE